MYAQFRGLSLHTDIIRAGVYGLIAFEIILGSLLIFKYNRKVLYTTIVTLSVFSIFLAYKIITHDPLSCGCFGNWILTGNHQELTLDLFLLLIGIYLT